METLKIDWSELAYDLMHRVLRGEAHAQILEDLYYGIVAEIEYHGLEACEHDIENFAKEFFECVVTLCHEADSPYFKRLLIFAVPCGLRSTWLLTCRRWLKRVLASVQLPQHLYAATSYGQGLEAI